MQAMLSIGEVAERTGLATSAIRFYEREGLIQSVRTSGGQRRFRREVLRRIAFVRVAQRVGLSLEEIIEAMANLPVDRAPSRQDWQRITRGWQQRLDERLAMLEALRGGLTNCIGCGCLSLRTCALANPEDWASTLGPGPRYLIEG
jgi:MerR family redox-sensitive transcriptional activator SoxR